MAFDHRMCTVNFWRKARVPCRSDKPRLSGLRAGSSSLLRERLEAHSKAAQSAVQAKEQQNSACEKTSQRIGKEKKQDKQKKEGKEKRAEGEQKEGKEKKVRKEQKEGKEKKVGTEKDRGKEKKEGRERKDKRDAKCDFVSTAAETERKRPAETSQSSSSKKPKTAADAIAMPQDVARKKAEIAFLTPPGALKPNMDARGAVFRGKELPGAERTALPAPPLPDTVKVLLGPGGKAPANLHKRFQEWLLPK